MVLELGHFEKQIRNTWKVLKCAKEDGEYQLDFSCHKWEVLHKVNILHTIKQRKTN